MADMTYETPQTILDWVRQYHQRRRKQLGSEDTFQRHVRCVFRFSGFVKHRGWQLATWKRHLRSRRTSPSPSLLSRFTTRKRLHSERRQRSSQRGHV